MVQGLKLPGYRKSLRLGKLKDGGIFFKYDGEAQEWQLPVDIAKGEIAYGSLVYIRKE